LPQQGEMMAKDKSSLSGLLSMPRAPGPRHSRDLSCGTYCVFDTV
jgi:hypothetical protein